MGLWVLVAGKGPKLWGQSNCKLSVGQVFPAKNAAPLPFHVCDTRNPAISTQSVVGSMNNIKQPPWIMTVKMIELAVFAGFFPVKRIGEVHQAHHQLIELLHSHMVEHPDFARSTHWFLRWGTVAVEALSALSCTDVHALRQYPDFSICQL